MYIGVGTILISRFSWIMYIFGGFLIFTGIRMAFDDQARVGHGGDLVADGGCCGLQGSIRPAGSREGPRLMPPVLQFVAIGMPVGAHRGNPVPRIDPRLQNRRSEASTSRRPDRIADIHSQETP